ncbi:MAG: DUF1697 domain-containing protein [Novosphingobium sp.]|nr:DUF1697 domain-containing protein [Novosphingobium sp.]
MTRSIAFLRAINVGGHTVKMYRLRQLFESLGFSSVETFIASGNVVFEAPSQDAAALESRIEKRLLEALGYEVATFIRTDAELAAIASYKPFRRSQLDGAVALNIGFLKDKLDNRSKRKLMALRTDIDDFDVHDRELHWLCRKRQSDSTLSNVVFEKALGQRATFRGVNTVRRMAAQYVRGGWQPA